MKSKLLLFFLCSLLLASNLSAQKFRTGIGISAIIPILEPINYSENSRANLGFGVAIKEEFNFHKNVGIIVSLEYQNWGVEFDGPYYDYPNHLGNVGFDKYHHKIRVNEMLVPVMIRIDSDSLFENKSLYLVGGYVFRYIVSSRTEITFNTNNELLWKGGARFYNPGDFGCCTIIGGVGMDLEPVKNWPRMYAELAYQHNLRHFVYNGKKEYATNDLGIVLSSVVLTLGLYL